MMAFGMKGISNSQKNNRLCTSSVESFLDKCYNGKVIKFVE